jgi:hypothetical protein
MPHRVQRRRKKGWRLPANTVSVTRPGKWSNPFRVGGWFRWEPRRRGGDLLWSEAPRPGEPGYTQISDKAMAVAWFAWLMEIKQPDFTELRGKNLACWCKMSEPCHADHLLHRANPRA